MLAIPGGAADADAAAGPAPDEDEEGYEEEEEGYEEEEEEEEEAGPSPEISRLRHAGPPPTDMMARSGPGCCHRHAGGRRGDPRRLAPTIAASWTPRTVGPASGRRRQSWSRIYGR